MPHPINPDHGLLLAMTLVPASLSLLASSTFFSSFSVAQATDNH